LYLYIEIIQMKILFTIALLLISLFSKADSWVQKADFGGGKRTLPFSFSIGSKGYIGTGFDSTLHNLKDFWEYDPSLDTWTQKANFAGGATSAGFGFSISNKGYAGLSTTNQFYEYDHFSNTWTEKVNYPPSNWEYSVSFSIGNFGYVCTGYYPCSKELWQYDPGLDLWTQKNNLPGVARNSGIGFSIGTKGYVGAGENSSNLLNDFWEYNSLSDLWTQKANTPGAKRADAIGFSICNKGYIALGDTSGGFLNDLWEYDTTANQWTQKTNFAGTNRDELACFVIGDRAYIGLGGQDGSGTGIYFLDFYEYTPDEGSCTIGINELACSAFQFQVSPNPVHQWLVVGLTLNPPRRTTANSRCEIYIMDVYGQKVFSSHYELRTNNSELVDVSGLSEGLYFIVADDGRERAVRKFVKE